MSQSRSSAVYDLRGFCVVLRHVRNIYPVEKADCGFAWGFKFSDGFYETFTSETEEAAGMERKGFISAIEAYWHDSTEALPP